MFLLQVWIGARLDDAVVFFPVTVTGCRAAAVIANLTAFGPYLLILQLLLGPEVCTTGPP